MLYGLLKSKKPADPPAERGYTPELWRELDDLYRGGYQIQARADAYLPKCVGESESRHSERLRLAAYIGYFGQIVNVYTSALFGGQVSVIPAADAEDETTPGELPDPEAYAAFGRNADLKGSAFSEVLKAAAVTAFVKGKSLLAVDFPAAAEAGEVATRADSDAAGLARPYVYPVEPEELIDWEYDSVVRRRVDLGDAGAVEFEVGCFAWVVLRSAVARRPSPEVGRGAAVEEFKIWKRRPDDGVVVWELYRAIPKADGESWKDEDDVPLAASGETAFREIPLVEIRIPESLWLGNVIGPLNKEHWQRRSALLSAQQRSLLVIPTVYLSGSVPDVGGSYNEAADNPHRGNDPARRYERMGYLVLADKDKLAFEGPPTEAFTVVNTQLKELVDELHRVSGRMAASISSTSKALSRSGASKNADNRDFDTVCMALGAVIRDGARRAYTIVSETRGEDVVWAVHGLDRFDSGENRAEVIEEATQMGSVDLGSVTAKIEWRARTAFRLMPGLTPEEQATIRAEIVESTTAAQTAVVDAAAVKKPPAESDETAADEAAETPEEQAREEAEGTEMAVGAGGKAK